VGLTRSWVWRASSKHPERLTSDRKALLRP
jgi:hypothetical protein